jgi:hypothetical protein
MDTVCRLLSSIGIHTPLADNKITVDYTDNRGQDSSVGIAARYSLDGPGIKSQWG